MLLVRHGRLAEELPFGYRFETPDRVIVVSGDCARSPDLIEISKGCDVLIHEVYSQAGWENRPPEWQKYHASFHTSSIELGKIAAEIKPGLLILYHQLPMGETPEVVLEEIRQSYDGKVVYGNDLEIY